MIDIKQIKEKLDIDLIGTQGKTEWERLFIVINNVQCGRINLFNGSIYSIKQYGKDEYRNVWDYSDSSFLKLRYYLSTGVFISDTGLGKIINKAKLIIKLDMLKKDKWRRENPKYNKEGIEVQRRGLKQKSLYIVVRNILLNAEGGDN